MYRGFTKKFLPVLAQKHLVSVENCFMWNVYTDMDIQEKEQEREGKGRLPGIKAIEQEGSSSCSIQTRHLLVIAWLM